MVMLLAGSPFKSASKPPLFALVLNGIVTQKEALFDNQWVVNDSLQIDKIKVISTCFAIWLIKAQCDDAT